MLKTGNKAYFIGIAGKTMGQLAKAFRDIGWEVSGSDHQGIYPPVSTYLQENKIPHIEGYNASNVPLDADLVIVGRSALMVDSKNPEYLTAKKAGLTVISYPEALQKYLIKENSVVVAGTYGKTTTSCLLSWILQNAGFYPSYMVGGLPLNFSDGVKISNSNWSVVEGDEPPALLPSDPSKFMFYRPKYLLLTATFWDHPEVFKTETDYLKAFKKLVELLPANGLLVYNFDHVKREVIEKARCKKVSYSFNDFPDADYYVKTYSRQSSITTFSLNKNLGFFQTSLMGEANLENICGAITLCLELGIKKDTILHGIKTFEGVKTRLELVGKFGGRYLYWDIAQHPEKVKGTLATLRENFPDKKIICVFDPAMTGLKVRESLNWYSGAFDKADITVVGKVGYLGEVKGKERVTGTNIVKAISQTQKNVFYEPIDEKIINYLSADTKSEDVIIFMSSGGLRFTNLIERTKREMSGE